MATFEKLNIADEKKEMIEMPRHSFIQMTKLHNVIALLADLMGHESIETTRIYLRRTASEQQELVDKIVTW